MAETTQVTVTREWTKLADGDCTVQTVSSSELVQIAVSALKPTTDHYLQLTLAEPATFAYKTAVWCRLTHSSGKESVKVNVIK